MGKFNIDIVTQRKTAAESFELRALEHNIPKSAIEEVQRNSEKIADLLKNSKSLLVYGQVQSGKTLNYTGLIADSFSKDCRLAIVLAGTKTNLVQQTYARLTDYYRYATDVRVIQLTTGGERDFIRQYHQFLIDNKDLKVVVVLLKHRKYLTILLKQLNNYLVDTLLIDDEADQASLNTFELYSKKNDVEKMSVIYSLISSLISFQNVKIVQYTATPQALFLLDGDNDLCPEMYFVQMPPTVYFGISDLLDVDINYVNLVNGENPDLQILIIDFVQRVSNLIGDGYDENISMMIHTHWNTKKLSEDFLLVNEIVKKVIVEPELFNLHSKFQGKEKQFLDWFDANMLVHKVFGDNNEVSWNKQVNILVGGNMLERGYTIPGLVSSVLTRNSKSKSNADSLQQRCRFLGYRESIKNQLVVHLTKEIHEDFIDYAESQNLLLAELGESGRISDFSKRFFMDNLNPTRSNVLPKSLKRSLANKPLILSDLKPRKRTDAAELLKAYKSITTIDSDLLSRLMFSCGLSPINVEGSLEFRLMTNNDGSIRSRQYSDGKVNELFQGSNARYPGDRYLSVNPNIQLHIINEAGSERFFIYLVFFNVIDKTLVYVG